jgi:heme exporter protein D
MHWNSLSEFLAMGGYGFYVWCSFGVTFAAMALELWLINQRRQRVTQIVKQEAF